MLWFCQKWRLPETLSQFLSSFKCLYIIENGKMAFPWYLLAFRYRSYCWFQDGVKLGTLENRTQFYSKLNSQLLTRIHVKHITRDLSQFRYFMLKAKLCFSDARKVFCKNLRNFAKIHRKTPVPETLFQKNCRPQALDLQLYLKRVFFTGVFLWILWNS